jgi:hypothetical protein
MTQSERALTQRELNAAGCAMPNCTHEDHATLFLHARCHMKAGTFASYNKLTGTMRIECARCKAVVAEILVASARQ